MSSNDASPTATLEKVASLLSESRVKIIDGRGHQVVLTPEVIGAFQYAIAGLLAPTDDELTTQQAAKLLGVSRPTLIRLLETGSLAYRRTNGEEGHRRIARSDAHAYLRADLERRREALDVLAQDAESFGFFDK
jgi:excisionase family DNA binding protein